MVPNLTDKDLIACMVEGGAENAIINILLDSNSLIFTRNQLIDRKPIARMGVKDFQNRYLKMEYDSPISVVLVIDSRSEQFKLTAAYQHQVKQIIKVLTTPEIESLIVVAEGKWDEFKKSQHKKPSDYCRIVLGMSDVKSVKSVSEYFSNADFLLDTIREYHRVHPPKNNEVTLFDLLKF